MSEILLTIKIACCEYHAKNGDCAFLDVRDLGHWYHAVTGCCGQCGNYYHEDIEQDHEPIGRRTRAPVDRYHVYPCGFQEGCDCDTPEPQYFKETSHGHSHT